MSADHIYRLLVGLLVLAAVAIVTNSGPDSCPAVYPAADSAPSPLYGFDFDPDDGRWTTPTGHTFGWSEQEDTIIYACPGPTQ